jgi:hypothetical protein
LEQGLLEVQVQVVLRLKGELEEALLADRRLALLQQDLLGPPPVSSPFTLTIRGR